MADYQYKACGLDNVLIRGFEPVIDDDGHKVFRVPNINLLHKAIAAAIVEQPVGMTGSELRFLRTEMGLTQSE
ncbi:MAG: transcriptional regulator, partial [Pseudomonadales bacterium]